MNRWKLYCRPRSNTTIPAAHASLMSAENETGTEKKWQDAGIVWSIWMMACRDGISILSYQSVASRLYTQIRDSAELDQRVVVVRNIVGRWRELFRPGAYPPDLEQWKEKLKNLEHDKYPEWLVSLGWNLEQQQAQIALLQNNENLFRSQFRLKLADKISSAEDVKLGLDYIDGMRSALLEADKENRAARLETERDRREAQKHTTDRRLIALAVVALLVPAGITTWTSYNSNKQSVRTNELKKAEIDLHREDKKSRDDERLSRSLAIRNEADAKFVGLLAKVYVASLNREKTRCVTLTGDLDSAFSALGMKRNTVRSEYESIRQLCIDTVAGSANIAGRRTQVDRMLKRARAALEQ